jgi:GLPGLI family protein
MNNKRRQKTFCENSRFNKEDFLLTAFFLLITGYQCAFAQVPYQQLKIRYLITEDYSKQKVSVSYLNKKEVEQKNYVRATLDESKYYMEMFVSADETHYIYSEEPVLKTYSVSQTDDFFMHRNYRKLAFCDQIRAKGKTYIIRDTLTMPQWKILNDIKEISGHMCMGASRNDTLRMQRITAWFAPDIPLSGGPDNLCGLPGLILEADVNDGAMTISANKIERFDVTERVKLPVKMKGKKITKSQYDAIVLKHMQEARKTEEFPFYGIRYL